MLDSISHGSATKLDQPNCCNSAVWEVERSLHASTLESVMSKTTFRQCRQKRSVFWDLRHFVALFFFFFFLAATYFTICTRNGRLLSEGGLSYFGCGKNMTYIHDAIGERNSAAKDGWRFTLSSSLRTTISHNLQGRDEQLDLSSSPSSYGGLAKSNQDGSLSTTFTPCQINEVTIPSSSSSTHVILTGAHKGGVDLLSKYLEEVMGVRQIHSDDSQFWLSEMIQGHESTPKCEIVAQHYRSLASITTSPSSSILYEKSPKLLASPQAAHVLRDVLGPYNLLKILVILRDPVDRFVAEYQRLKDVQSRRQGNILTIEDLLEREVRHLHALRLVQDFPLLSQEQQPHEKDHHNPKFRSPHYNSTSTFHLDHYNTTLLGEGVYSKQLQNYLDEFSVSPHHRPQLKLIQYEHFKENKLSVLNDILDFIGLPRIIGLPARFLTDKPSSFLRSNGAASTSLNQEPNHVLSNRTRAYLKAFYRPFNEELEALLGSEWKGVWTQ